MIKSDNLVSCFLSTCEKQFSFLETEHNFVRCAGLAQYKNGRTIIKPYQGVHHDPVFWIIARYEKDNLALEMTYGDKTYDLEGHILHNQIRRFSFSELLETVQKDGEPVRMKHGITAPELITEHVGIMAETVRQFKRYFLKYDDKTAEKAALMRATRLKQAIHDQHERNLENVTLMSARAFQESDYQRVIELLRPYEQYLGKAEVKKLHLAQQKFLGGKPPPLHKTSPGS